MGDYTRWTFDPTRDYAELFKQQGRVDLDADWNELVEIVNRRWRAETIDIIGRAVVPESTPNAFWITPSGPGQFSIGIGRMYVDGLLAECHGIAQGVPPTTYNASLGEVVGNAPVPFNSQPYYPNPTPLPSGAGTTDLIYLDVWSREVTAMQDPVIREKALGGPDTATRMQTVWQVKVWPDVGQVGCGDDIPGWDALTAPSAGRLTTSTVVPAPSPDPCILSPTGGYRGLENRLYRVEVHVAGAVGGTSPAKFKWSRDNASVVSAVTSISAPGGPNSVVTLKSLGRDRVLRFQADDWVEILDDNAEFAGTAGFLTKITTPPDQANRTITVNPPIPAGLFDPTNDQRHTRVRRWDERFTGAGSDVDPATGLIDVTVGPLDIEDGIQVSFSDDPVGGQLHVGDYWMFAARTADGSVEPLKQAPPRGILHHYARLGFVTWTATSGQFSNCRQFWPPDMGASCDCSVCVSADSHNNGTLTLQSAINQVQGKGGGKVCLGPGIYNITDTVMISAANAIQISGHGLPSLVATGLSPKNPIMQIDSLSVDIIVEDIGFTGPAAGPNQQPVPGLVVTNSTFVRVKRCLFSGSTTSTTTDAAPGSTLQAMLSPAIGLAGFVLGADIKENVFNIVQVGIGSVPAVSRRELFLAHSSIQNNEMACTAAGLMFADSEPIALFQEVSFADNSVASVIGFQFRGQGLDIAIERNSFVVSASDVTKAGVNAAIACGGSQTRIINNQIFADPKSRGRDGIVLDGNVMHGTQVTGNFINGLAGHGILVKHGMHFREIFAENQLVELDGAGIMMETLSFGQDLTISHNSLESVGLTATVDSWLNQPIMGGILLETTLGVNVNVSENVIEVVGPDKTANASRAGIWVLVGMDVRVAANRVVDIGPTDAVNFSAGILVLAILGRADVGDNEVRRASLPPPNSTDASQWYALLIGYVSGDVNIRGNLLESFGNASTARLVFARSCIFNDNQCFLDNMASQTGGPQPVIVSLGAGAIIASNNYLKGPSGEGNQSMVLADKRPITVLGNISSGSIMVGAGTLQPPWAPLNLTNAAL